MRIACVIPTYNGKAELSRLLDSIRMQTVQADILIIDSSSTDGTQSLAKVNAKKLVVIPSHDFNHGASRQLMVTQSPEYDFYVFLTQDAYLAKPDAIENLVRPFCNPVVGAVCGRQLPHLDAKLLAKHARYFNYPDVIEVKSVLDVPRFGIKTAFISNSFAAYRAGALNDVGGFPNHVIFGEDMYTAAKMLLAGWQIAYAGDAVCRHSHNYTIIEEFERYFDMGVFHAQNQWIRENFGSARGEGLRYVISEIKFLGFSKIYFWPSSLLRNGAKLLGYKLGQHEAKIPIFLKRRMSMQKRFWDRRT